MLNYTEQNLHRYNKEKRTSFITVVDCATTYAPRGWQHKQRFLEYYELIFVSKGSLCLQFSRQDIIVSEGQVCIFPPYKTFCGKLPCSESTVFYSLDFMTDNRELFNINSGVSSVSPHSDFENCLRQLDRAVKQNCSDFVKDAYLIIILNELFQNRPRDYSNNRLAQTVAEYIDQNIFQPLTVKKIADDLNYNKDYLCKTVKSFYGITLKDYITTQKLDAAKRLLATSNYSTADISEYLGFADPNSFTKFFKYHVKTSPMQYKKQHM